MLAPFDSDVPFDSACVAHLNAMVGDTGASLVITSSWRERRRLAALRDEFDQAGFRGVIVGVTPILLGRSRGEEIRAYLGELDRAVEFVVVDDQVDMDAELRERLVHVDGEVGLQQADVDRALALMRCAVALDPARR